MLSYIETLHSKTFKKKPCTEGEIINFMKLKEETSQSLIPEKLRGAANFDIRVL